MVPCLCSCYMSCKFYSKLFLWGNTDSNSTPNMFDQTSRYHFVSFYHITDYLYLDVLTYCFMWITIVQILFPETNTWHVVDPLPGSPLVVFVNSKSGGGHGNKFLRRFKQILNPGQVFDLSHDGPTFG